MKYDLVFEGGGAKGMVFVGACEEFFRRGHSFDRLLGTSAGAITATLLAAGYGTTEFDMGDDRRNALVEAGRTAMALYLDTPPDLDLPTKGVAKGPGGRVLTKADRIAGNLLE